MAKHIKNTNASSTQSKGKRVSCYGNKKHAIKPVGGSTDNAMRTAFLSAQFPDSVRFSRLGSAIIKVAQVAPKLTHDQQRGWSTALSFRTFKALQDQGVL
jgi:hypothetical protein